MRSRTFIFLLSLMFFIPVGCSKKKQISGKIYIPKEVLVDVLVDLHLVDGLTNDRKFYRKYTMVDSIDVLGPVLEKYEITQQMFDTTLYEYSHYPVLMDEVYNEVLMKLNIMLDENDQEEFMKPEE
jgi:uncharacterized protein DUF4296